MNSKMLSPWFSETEKKDFRTASFNPKNKITTRPGLVYEVLNGGVKVHQQKSKDKFENKYQSLINLSESQSIFEVFDGMEVTVLEDDTVITWHNQSHLLEDKHLVHRYMQDLRKKNQLQCELTTILGNKHTEDRILGLLNFLVVSYPLLSKNTQVPGNLTHGEIAATVGTTRVTVTRLIGEMRKNNIIDTDESGKIIIL